MTKRLVLTFLSGLFVFTMIYGQKESEKKSFFSEWKISPVVGAQMWSTYTTNTKLYDLESGEYLDVDGRVNFVLRRSRLGVKLNASDNITVNLVAAIDNVGRDVLSGYPGGANSGSFPQVGLWNAYVQWRLKKRSEALYLIAGYHTPYFSRESITAWHSVSSLGKSISQSYVRRHLTGKNPGRTMGVALGGLLYSESSRLGMQYAVGVYNSVFGKAIGNSAGVKSSPLVTGRVMLIIGDPETTTFKIGHRFNTFNKRKGVSIGISGSHEGSNQLFSASYATAIDVLFNYGPWNVGGEWVFLWRDGSRELDNGDMRVFTASSETGFIRASYNITLKSGQLIEPSLAYMTFQGATDKLHVEDAAAVVSSAGKANAFDVGVNWHLQPGRLNIRVHYTFQGGDAGFDTLGSVVNDFFVQSGVALQRGDYFGAGLIFIL